MSREGDEENNGRVEGQQRGSLRSVQRIKRDDEADAAGKKKKKAVRGTQRAKNA